MVERFHATDEPMTVGDGADIIDANPAMCALLGRSRESLRGIRFKDIAALGLDELNRLDEMRRAAGFVAGDATLLRGDGTSIAVRYWSLILTLGPGLDRAYTGFTPLERFPSTHETNALLRDLFDESPDGKLVVDRGGRTIYVNQRHLDQWNLTREDLEVPFEGRWAKTAARLQDPEQFIAMRRAVRAGQRGPFRLDLADGRVLEVRAVPLHRGDGATTGFSYTTRDFTSDVQAREALQTHAALLEAVSSNSPDGILVIDNAGAPLHYNERFLELWGLDREHFGEPLQARLQAVFSRVANPEPLYEAVRSLKDSSAEVLREFELLDGRTVSGHAVPIMNAAGERIGYAYHFRDVSAERKAERELRESEDRYRTLVSSLQVGVVMQFADGRIGECNPAAEQILGLTREELLGLTSLDPRWNAIHEDGTAYPGEEHPAVITLRTGQACNDIVMGVRHVNGALRWLLVNSEPICAPGGAVEATVVSFQDITEQRRGQAAVIQSRTAEALNALASGVAHKVNNSLASIVGNAYLAGLPAGVPEETVDSLTEIMSAASDATSLVRDLQALSRRERQGLRQVDVSEAASAVLAALPAEDRSRITASLQPELPAVLFDPGALEQAMASLLRNALEAGIQVEVRTLIEDRAAPLAERESAPRPAPAGRYLCFEVTDDGPGVQADVAGRIFEPFVTTKFVGRGLGLAATAGIMATHHGFVEVDSRAAGCTARLLLPLA